MHMVSFVRTSATIRSLLPRASSISKIMDSSSNAGTGGSQRLFTLAQHLRQYKAPSFPEDIVEQRIEESGGKVVTQVGFPEAATPVGQNPEKFRPKKAAVLICLFEGDDGDLRVILTKRSSKLSTHSGEVALPGGKAEEGDKDDGDTAKREAKEEIGLDPELVNVVTVLQPFLSKDENRRQEEREWMGEKFLLHFFDYGVGHKKYLIWGLTAGILIRAASVVYQRPPAFVEQNPKFKVPQNVSNDTTLP
ncbi:nudix hydrolase 15, mitochondrial isoform X2 [Vigna angularis]|uniref:nudix hydrolase 15, mitochondrial isoform X2 n=1 Tax=Phaseolus angularis TaxID=3914 RepID=UPI0022B46F29|nr:nudix hydrolase 15, mitochondrial isoform X2 [Vigna angularis]